MDDLTALLNYSMKTEEQDNKQLVTELGRKLNRYSENPNHVSEDEHKQLLMEIETLFRRFGVEYLIDGGNSLYDDFPRMQCQYIHIKHIIKLFLNLLNANEHVLTLYSYAKEALIHLYFLANELDTGPEVQNNVDIHNYKRPVTFYEFELNDLSNDFEKL